jgi:hypothetical protein
MIIQPTKLILSSIENTIRGPCELVLLFSDDDFVPITFAIEPIACSASQLAEISIPFEVPNGSATLLWLGFIGSDSMLVC